ncbi:hypothetical protein JCM10213v2_007939 [Rhodosporidiobolus nylandii]
MIPGGVSEGTSSLIGVGLSVGASILIACGLNVQRLEDERTPLLVAPAPLLPRSASDPTVSTSQPQILIPAIRTIPATSPSSPAPSRHRRSRSRSSTRAPRTDKGFIRSPLWLAGFLLLNIGEFGNFLAYGFAPPSVVAPLGLVTLVANVFLAPAIVGEPFRRKDLLGVAIAILGGATVVYASRSSDKKPTPDELLAAISRPLFIVYASISSAAIAFLAYLSRTKWGDRFVIIDLSLCALAGAFTVLSTKALSSFLNLSPVLFFKSWLTYPVLAVLIFTAILQVNFVNKSLQRFESRIVIPIQYCTFALSTIVGSAVLYRDFEGVALPSLVNFVFGCLICGGGVYLLTRDPSSPSSPSPASPLPTPVPSPTLSHKSIPFPSPAARLLPVPITAVSAPPGGRGRKLSLTLGGGYLLAGSPIAETVDEREEEEDAEQAVGRRGG